jgi:NADPH-dependent curcumin reductase CurA
LDGAIENMNDYGRVVLCGLISQYNGESYGYTSVPLVLIRRIKMEG